ncbi:MAG: hypothetical protein HOW97_01970 [Catenulispora sp.]|nr:hypothetical protein [Catenulispora sp.]
MSPNVSLPDHACPSLQSAVHRATAGAKKDADAAGRLLLAIPADAGDAATAEAEAVLAAADPRFWVALESARDWLYWESDGRLGAPVGSDSLPALMVKALMADGRLREPAVRLLAEAESVAALPVLGLRAADWVPIVRDVARGAILRRLEDDPDGAALAALAPMAFLVAGRQQGGWLLDEVTRRLREPAAGPVVSQLLGSSDAELRRAAYQVLTELGKLTLEQAIQAAVRDRDIVIRSRTAAYAGRLAVETDSLTAARQLLASRTPLVRAEALQALNRLGDLDAVRSALVDRSSLVRGTARFYLRPHGVDFPAVYRLRLGEGGDAVTPYTVAGLVEVGSADDTELFWSLVRHPIARVRVEALRGLQAFAPAINGDDLLALVAGDPSAAVVRQAAATIIARDVVLDTDRLLDLLDSARPVSVRLAAHRLLAARDTAWRLAADVMLLADAEPVVAAYARHDVNVAVKQQMYVRPSGRTAELLAAHLPAADRLLPPVVARNLRIAVGMRLPSEPTEPGAADG